MTLWDVLAALGRRWYIAVAGILCTALAIMAVRTQPPVYYSRVLVYFLAPASAANPNVLSTTSLSLVSAAGVVGKRVNGNTQLSKTASADVTLVGRGILDGTAVMLPDHGGQWSADYDTQALDVQVAAATPDEVRARQSELFARIDAELESLQDEFRVPPVSRISTQLAPSSPVILEMRGERRRGMLMCLVLGGLLTLLTIGSVELRSGRRRAREALGH